jgi:Leucine-rich repeat (LRR) protein
MKQYSILIFVIIFSCTSPTNREVVSKLNLSGKKLTAIPDSIYSKTDLTYLDLGSSSITIFPPLSALEDTNANRIAVLPEKIGQLVNLKTLVLNSNQLSSLPAAFIKLKNLEELDLSINKSLYTFNELEKLRQLKQLKVLKIFDTEDSEDDIKKLQTALPQVKIISSIPEYIERIK